MSYGIAVADTVALVWQEDGDSLWTYTQPEHCTSLIFYSAMLASDATGKLEASGEGLGLIA